MAKASSPRSTPSASPASASRGSASPAAAKSGKAKKAAAKKVGANASVVQKSTSTVSQSKSNSLATGKSSAMNSATISGAKAKSGAAAAAKSATRPSAGAGRAASKASPSRASDPKAAAGRAVGARDGATTSKSSKPASPKSIGESRSKRPSTHREPQVDVLAAQAAAKQSRERPGDKKSSGNVEADDRTSRSAGRHSGAGDAEYVTEKGDARRRDPDINKNSQAQKDDVRDGQRDQDPHPKKRSDGGRLQDGGARQAQASRSRPPQTTGPTRK